MSTEFPLDLFPVQLFPDVELDAVRVNDAEKTLIISVSDSGWALSQDIEFFFGEGDMVFHFSGQPEIGWKCLDKETWDVGGLDLLHHLDALEIIRRQSNGSWLFQFATRQNGCSLVVVLESVTKIEWTGEVDRKLYDILHPIPAQ